MHQTSMTEYVGKIAPDYLSDKKRITTADKLSRYYSDAHIVNKPFYFHGTNKRAILLLHGWTSTPYEMRALGEYLNQSGFSVYAPLLTGHGTQPEDLEGVTWKQWLIDAEEAYSGLGEDHEEVYIGGMSAGGSLALHIAQKHPDVAGLLLMGTPYRLRYERVGYYLARLVKKFSKYKTKRYPRALGVRPSMTQLISYQRYPIESAIEAYGVIKASTQHLNRVTQPCMIIQSRHDHLVERDSISRLHASIASQKKEMRVLHNVSHNFIGDAQKLNIFKDILKFLEA